MNDHIEEAILDKIIFTFYLSLFCLVYILLIVCNNSLWKSLSDCVDLRYVSTTSYSDSDVKILESLQSKKKNRFKNFHPESLGFEKFNWWPINSEDTFSCFDSSNSNWIFLSSEALNNLGVGLWHMAIYSFIKNEELY